MQAYIEQYLAPRIQGDGGWVEFDALNGQELRLIFRGECSKCPILSRCTAWMEEMILRDLGQPVRIVPVRIKPYFQDT